MTEQNALAIRDDMSLSQLGKVFVESGFFSDTRQASQAIVKVLAGRELGFGPIASMTGVYVIQGRISLSANLLAAAIKRTGKYNFVVKQMTDDVCEIEYREKIDGKWETIGNSKFTAADAKRAQTKNMDKFPRNMLYARAMSNGARWYCPDVFGGPVYTPEELGANVTEDGEVIDIQPTIVINGQPVQPMQSDPAEPAPNGHKPEPVAADADKPVCPIYTSPRATIHKHQYPSLWVKAIMAVPEYAADQPHIDNILQNMALPQATDAADVVAKLNAHMAAKANGG